MSIWESLLGRKPIGVFDNFFDLGGHSLLAARLFTQIGKLSGKNLPLSMLFHAPTIHGLAAVLREEGVEPSWSSLVPIKPGGTRSPFYCVHAAGGNVIGYQNLASRLDADQPVYGLQARGLDGNKVPLERVEEMAALYVQEIRALQPRGPYDLGGACTGGIVAYEMARQLVAQGEEVGVLAMFDTFAHGALRSLPRSELRRFRLESSLARLTYHVTNLIGEPGRIQYIKKKLRTLARRFNTRLWGLKRRVYYRLHRPLPPVLQRVEKLNMLAIKRYEPGLYPGKITLFPPSTRSVGEFPDPKQGWGKLALGGVEIHHVSGNHLTMLQEPFVGVVAEQLTECLRCSREKRSMAGENHADRL